MGLVSFISGPVNPTFFRLGPGPYLAANTAVPVGLQNSFWPQLVTNTPAAAGDPGVPQYIWYQSSVNPALAPTGETVFFARQITASFGLPIAVGLITPLFLHVIADNAFQARVRIQPLDILGIALGPPTILDFTDGNTSQAFNQVDPPFAWSTAYTFIRELGLVATVAGFDLQFEFKVVNWNQPGGIPQTNPAGFTYALVLDLLFPLGIIVTPTFTNVTPPVISAPLT